MLQNDIEIKEKQFSNAELLPEIVKMLNEGHTVTLRLRGFSMRPFLEDNRDKALLTKAHDVKEGDPVLAEIAPKQYVLHRIVKIEGDKVTLRGDGNLNEEHCLLNDVKGSVIGFYRKERHQLDRTDGQKWLIYSYIWTRLYPVRRYLLAFYRHIWLKIFKSNQPYNKQ
jgi:hypothetical protein